VLKINDLFDFDMLNMTETEHV